MQISTQEVLRISQRVRESQRSDAAASRPQTVEDLAALHGVRMDEVRRFTQRAVEADEDPWRARRLRELERRIAEGTYSVDTEQVLDMAERRAIADRAGL